MTITATNTLTGKKVISSTDLDGSFVLAVPTNGRYVVRAELAAFASSTNEALINANSRTVQVNVDLMLLSRAPVAPASEQADAARTANVLAGARGSQPLAVTAEQGASESFSNGSESMQNMPALASSPDAANESIAVSGAMGQTQDFGRNIEDMRDRIEEMRARGDLPGGAGGPGGPGGPGGGVFVMGGPGGMGGGRGGRMGRFNVNQPHGMLFYSMGNSALDAAPYSLSGRSGSKPEYSSNRFGGTIGGPLKIPHVLDAGQNTFFFFNIFGTRATSPYQVFSHVPTADERAGIFSQTVIDPATGVPFANNTIPVARMDSAALGLLKFIPLPNQPGLQNFLFSSAADNANTNISFRIMHNFGSRTSNGRRRNGGGRGGMFGRNNLNFGLNYSAGSSDQLRPFPTLGGTGHTKGLNANAGYTFSRGRWTNNFRTSFNRSRTNTQNLYAGIQNIAGDLGINGVSQNPADWGVPNISFTHFQGINDIAPVSRRDDTFQLMDTIIVQHGKHNVRFGGDYRHITTALRNNPNPRGSFTFTGFASGYDFADFLLGYAQQTRIQYSPNSYRFAANGWDAYVNDDWRIRGNLTLELGLRYEYIGPFAEAHNQIVNLDVAPGFTAAAPVQPGQTGPYTGVFPDSLVKPDRNNFAPRVGFAWKPFSKTVVRAGYGV
ncbi:MAG TPA: TonB-dependent receptor, partial [Terriglobales bacterium]|nr:TonB-dependent receptor [Terriglobales bacterium]